MFTFTDVDECKEGNHNCSNFATCINMNQGYDCECHVGFVGDGVTCRGTIMIGYHIICMLLLNAPCLLCVTIVSDALTSVMSVVGGAIALVCLLSLVTI